MTGFEPATLRSQSGCATKLRHIPATLMERLDESNGRWHPEPNPVWTALLGLRGAPPRRTPYRSRRAPQVSREHLVDTGPVSHSAYESLLELIADSPALPSGGRIIAIDGRSGAGKTTVATALAAALDCPILTVDELCPGWDGLGQVPTLLAAALEPLAQGRSGHYRRYDWITGERDGNIELEPTAWLVVDGVGSASRLCRPSLTYVIWIEADEAHRKARALARDGAVFAGVWDRWAVQESALFEQEQTAAAADAVLTEDPQTGILALGPIPPGAMYA